MFRQNMQIKNILAKIPAFNFVKMRYSTGFLFNYWHAYHEENLVPTSTFGSVTDFAELKNLQQRIVWLPKEMD